MTLTLRLLTLTVILMLFGQTDARAATETQNFQPPSVRGVTLNWCKHQGRECGQPAADLFCTQNGFDRAQTFQHDPRAGARGVQSVIFGDGMLCNGTQCEAFGSILCVKRIADPVPQPTPQPTPQPAPQPQPSAPKPDVAEAPSDPIVRPQTAPTTSPRPNPRPLVGIVGPGTKPAEDPFVPPITGLKFFAKGAELFWCQSTGCDFATDEPLKVTPGNAKSEQFKSDLTAIPWAKAGMWQVSDRPFPAFQGDASDAKFTGLLDFGLIGGGVQTFRVDLDAAVDTSPFDYLSNIHVRVIPLRQLIGSDFGALPSNPIQVLYGASEPAPPDFTFIELDTSPLNLFEVAIVDFKLPDFYDADRWGCVVVTGYDHASPIAEVNAAIEENYPIGGEFCPKPWRGDGTRIDEFEEYVEFFADTWDWVGGAYDTLLEVAADIIMDYTPFGLQCRALADLAGESDIESWCRSAAEVAVQAGATALGLPPTIPSYNELIDEGVDYAVELAASEIESRTGIPCTLDCADALRSGLNHFADELKRTPDIPACVDPTEAHLHGSEPLCLPPSVVARPAPGAKTSLPYVRIEVTRTNVAPRPEHIYWDGECGLNIANVVTQTIPARTWFLDTQPVRSFDLPTQDVRGNLYKGVTFPLNVDMAAGEKLTISTTLSANWYGFPWMIKEWNKYQTVGPNVGVYQRDWMTLYFGGTMHLSADAFSSGGVSCLAGEDGDSRTITLPVDWPY